MAVLYEAYTVELPPLPVVLDLGCNVGKESYKLFKKFRPRLLISVDPFEENIAKCEELRQSLGISNEVWKTECCAVDTESGGASISFNLSPCLDGMPSGSIVVDEVDISSLKFIPTKRMSDIHPSPDIIKCDIEGHEWFVWHQLIDSPAKLMFIELHGHAAVDLPEKIRRMKDAGWSIRWFKYAQGQTEENDETVEMTEGEFNNVRESYCHILCEKQDEAVNG